MSRTADGARGLRREWYPEKATVGEALSLSNWLSKSSQNPEEKGDQGNPTGQSLGTASPGQADINQWIAKETQSTAEEMQLLFVKDVGMHWDDPVMDLTEKSASFNGGGCGLTTCSVL